MAADSDSERSNTDASEDPQNPLAPYLAEIELYERETKKWDRQCQRILKRYKDDRGSDGTVESQERRFNVLWSNTQNLKPILYARNPKPDIQRRFKDADPIGRVASDILERSVSYFCDTDHFTAVNQQCTTDYLLPGRAVVWVRYVPHFKPAAELTDDVGPGDDESDEDETPSAPEPPQEIDYEEVIPDYVHRGDFGHNVARTWDEVWLVWRKVYLTRKQLIARFGEEKGRLPALDYTQKDSTGKTLSDGIEKSITYEAWDKIRQKAIWFHKATPEPLDERPDPLGLENFFPCPKPLLTNLANDSLIPTPDYVEYQDQAAELDSLTQRIANITKALKVAGIYDASAEGLNRLFNEGTENELIPVQNWALFSEKGGIDGAMELIPLKDIASALIGLYEARDKVKADLDEITGMSDIIRGATDARETATAQKLKAGFGSQRISDRQREVQRFVRETIRLMVDVISNHFQLDTIKQISGVRLFTQAEKQAYAQAMQPPSPQPGQPATPAIPQQSPPLPPGVTPDQFAQMMKDPTWEEVEALIRNKALRCFRIDIETDSTIKMDEEAEKASRIEYVKVMGEFIAQAENAPPMIAPLMGATLTWLSRAFPVGKELEGQLNSAVQKLEQAAANPQPKPNPEMIKIQGEQQLNQQKMQQEGQIAAAKIQAEQVKSQGDIELQKAQLQADLQTGAAKLQQEKELAQFKMQLDAETDHRENMMEAQRESAKLEQEAQLSRMKLESETQLELAKAHIQQQTAIEVARINAKATQGAAEEAAAVEATKDDGGMSKEVVSRLDALLAELTKPKQDMTEPLKQLGDGIANLHKAVTSEKEIVRDPKTGKPSGVRIKADPKDLGQRLSN